MVEFQIYWADSIWWIKSSVCPIYELGVIKLWISPKDFRSKIQMFLTVLIQKSICELEKGIDYATDG